MLPQVKLSSLTVECGYSTARPNQKARNTFPFAFPPLLLTSCVETHNCPGVIGSPSPASTGSSVNLLVNSSIGPCYTTNEGILQRSKQEMNKSIQRPGVRAGYDQWSETYDTTPNPLVALDRRYTLTLLCPRVGERILDAGCGTGWNLRSLVRANSRPAGIDFSRGMLTAARRNIPNVPLAQADLNQTLPVRESVFDAVLCALVGEHLTNLPLTFRELCASLAPGGRLVFSVFHPEMAAAGIEANFERGGVEYRLGAYRYTVDDYLNVIEASGFRGIKCHEFYGDDDLVTTVPWAIKYLGRPLLLTIEARKQT